MRFLHAMAASSLLAAAASAAAAKNEARVTQIVREVNVLQGDTGKRAAELNDKISESEAVRTGGKSKSELTFRDASITRLGENTIFSFRGAARVTDLGGGSMLLHVRKGAEASIRTATVTVGVTGTTLIVEAARGGRSKLMMLEGDARLTLNRNTRQTAIVRGGQMLDIAGGATKLPPVQQLDVGRVMRTHPLIVGFRPLPSQQEIARVEEQQGGAAGGPIYQGQPVAGGTLGPGFGVGPLGPQTLPQAGRPPMGSGQDDNSDGRRKKKRRGEKHR